MPVVTRAQAHLIQEEEFALLRKIDVNFDALHEEFSVVTTRSATGLGIHKRWLYSLDRTLETILSANSGPPRQDFNSPNRLCCGEPQVIQDQRTSGQVTPEESECEVCTPESSSASPSTPKTHRLLSTRALADVDMKFLLHIKRGEDVEDALSRHVNLYIQESKMRQEENYRRVYNLVKNRPDLLKEVGEDTELFVRDDPQWDIDPFV
jgi:hypothetical protein